jgi:hypothetical protein
MCFGRKQLRLALSFLFLLGTGITSSAWEIPQYPRLANYYLPSSIGGREVRILSGWDLLVLYDNLDEDPEVRERVVQIKEQNPEIIILLYTSAIEANVTEQPPDPFVTACDTYDWWLRDWRGNLLYNPNFPWSMLVNMTNTQAASGGHPDDVRPNEWLPRQLMDDHLDPVEFWDGIFYDTFADNLTWMFTDQKDANRNGTPEYDNEENGNEPRFSSLWSEGMLTLLGNTIALEPGVLIVGNGQHRDAVEDINGRLLENFTLSSEKNMHLLSSNHQYLTQGERMPRVSIVNGWMKDTDPTEYEDMRFAFCATLMTDNFFSCDFGSQHHSETLWYDEYSILSNGDVDAALTRLRKAIDAGQTTIPVMSTQGFAASGIIEINGEQIYYSSKTDTLLEDCYRGFPRIIKYDLRAPHPESAKVIQHGSAHTGYLGEPEGSAFDPEQPSTRLDDLLEAAGWGPNEHLKEQINSRVWRRNFDNGAVLVNPTESTVLVDGLGNNAYRRIEGLQDALHNNGDLVRDTLRIDSGDGYILIAESEIDTIPPDPPQELEVRP